TILSETSSEFREIRQSPSGFWYPEVIVSRHVFRQNGEDLSGAGTTRWYLEFDKAPSDEFFSQPRVQGTGIPDLKRK
ncbi:MAG: hypothetical protein KDA80_12055, partial [Planctomycetaceae bacterium]|nr:hypothetical protein [Planctomycetaceae bacterium]